MKNISTGTGIALLAGAIVAYPIIDRVMPRAEAGATHVAAVVAAATAQNPPEPTIVWYGMATQSAGCYATFIARAWSDGRVEVRLVMGGCNYVSNQPWVIVSDPSQGYNAASDINFDSKVDGADLGTLLADWGNAPRHDVPPSTCPLNLINP